MWPFQLRAKGPSWPVMYSSVWMKAYLWARNAVVTLPRLRGPHSTRPSQVLLAYVGHGWTAPPRTPGRRPSCAGRHSGSSKAARRGDLLPSGLAKMFSVRAEVREAWVKGHLRPRKNVVRLDLQTGAEGEGRADVSEGAPLLDVVSPKLPEVEFHSLCSGYFRGKRPNFESSGKKN